MIERPSLGDEFEPTRNSSAGTRPGFQPRTAMEEDIHNAYNHFKIAGDGVMLFVSNSYDLDYSYLGKILINPINDPDYRLSLIHDAIDEVNKAPNAHQRVIVALDLGRSFEEQWPYAPGLFSPSVLHDNPVLPAKPAIEIILPNNNYSDLYERNRHAFQTICFEPEFQKVGEGLAPARTRATDSNVAPASVRLLGSEP